MHLWALLFGTLILSSCSKPEEVSIPPDTIAIVGETPILLADLQRVAAQNAYDLYDPDQRELAIRDAVNLELLAQEAKAKGFDQHPDILNYIRTESIRKLLAESVDAPESRPDPPSESEIQDYYQAHTQEFTPPSLAKARVLALLKKEGEETSLEQKQQSLETAIQSKQFPFSTLVERYSEDPAAKLYGGMTGWLEEGKPSMRYPDQLIEAIFVAAEGREILGPLEEGNWIYYYQLEEKRGGAPMAYADVRSRISRQLQRRKRLEAYDAYVASLGTKQEVQLFPETADAALQRQQSAGGPPAGPVNLPHSPTP